VLGELVDPGEIEAELLRLADGHLPAGSFAVAAVPDARSGHVLVPVFEPVHSDKCACWVQAYNDRAPGFKRLRPAFIISSLPRSPLGKIRRAALAGMLGQPSSGP
jgi:acyl-CoA synthetase (AMP-forming)/AMP-acid ligase II